MEVKKNPKIDLGRKRGMFFNIGLAISLSFVLASFELITQSKDELVDLGTLEMDLDEVFEIPITEIPPPPPPRIEQPIINEVSNEEEIVEELDVEIDIEFDETEIFEDPIFEEKLEEEVADEVKDFAEEMPTPIGGMQEFYKFLGKNIKYPRAERTQGIQGKVFLQFVIEKDGSLSDLKVVKGVSKGCDTEALRVLAIAPKWKPGKQGHRPVRVRMILPITFQLN